MSENFRCPRQAIAGWSTMHSQNGNSSKGDERHWIPLAKMMGGCIPPIPPAVDVPGLTTIIPGHKRDEELFLLYLCHTTHTHSKIVSNNTRIMLVLLRNYSNGFSNSRKMKKALRETQTLRSLFKQT